MNSVPLYKHTKNCLSIHLERYPESCQLLVIMNKATKNIHTKVSV